jgi:hypothetical protein
MTNFKVTWERWFRCGPYGDDTDFTTESMDFNTMSEAEEFVNKLCDGVYRGVFDLKVQRNEVSIKKVELV